MERGGGSGYVMNVWSESIFTRVTFCVYIYMREEMHGEAEGRVSDKI